MGATWHGDPCVHRLCLRAGIVEIALVEFLSHRARWHGHGARLHTHSPLRLLAARLARPAAAGGEASWEGAPSGNRGLVEIVLPRVVDIIGARSGGARATRDGLLQEGVAR